MVNSLAAQEFGSDYTDPYLVRGGGSGRRFGAVGRFAGSSTGSYERQDSLTRHARPVAGRFEPTVPAPTTRAYVRRVLGADRPPTLWAFGTELDGARRAARQRGTCSRDDSERRHGEQSLRTLRAFAAAQLERPFGAQRLVSVHDGRRALVVRRSIPPQEFVYLGGPSAAPGTTITRSWRRRAEASTSNGRCPCRFRRFRSAGLAAFPPSGDVRTVRARGVLNGQCARGITAAADHGAPEALPGYPIAPARSRAVRRRRYPSVGVGFLRRSTWCASTSRAALAGADAGRSASTWGASSGVFSRSSGRSGLIGSMSRPHRPSGRERGGFDRAS